MLSSLPLSYFSKVKIPTFPRQDHILPNPARLLLLRVGGVQFLLVHLFSCIICTQLLHSTKTFHLGQIGHGTGRDYG
ncbi:hypothetical protein BDV32DRAFT_19151 [Aspergillus pseudonomiae]|nr:hypothetical protein BDV32DRAFT_19151 [Aspergillus pseudonomiae]